MPKLNVLAVCGSLRTGSYNRKLLQIAKRVAEEAGAKVSELDLRELNLPIFDQDIQDRGFPESVVKLKNAVVAADVLFIASPENNYSVSAALKNAFDWGSRQKNAFAGKVAGIMSVSSGRFGGVRGQLHLRHILTELDVLVLPKPQVYVGPAESAFNPDGSLKDAKTMGFLELLIKKTLAFAGQLKR